VSHYILQPSIRRSASAALTVIVALIPPPSPPPLPFTFFGKVVDEQGVQVLLARGDRVLTIAVGQEIDKTYRLESYQNGILTFLYIPLDMKQTLPTGVPQ